MKPLLIGVDFDNTIVSYEGVFYKVGLKKNLIPSNLSPSKGAIRDYFRALGKEDIWTELQGEVYGTKMDLASPYEGVDTFFSICSEKQIPIFIISHKTQHPFLGPPYDLHKAAKNWLQKQKFTSQIPFFFEITLLAKLQRIRQQKCTVFIDDLPELLLHPDFPAKVQKILFDPHRLHSPSDAYDYATSWNEVRQILKVPSHGP